MQEIGLDTVRENVAVVLQHPALFNDTVRANLLMGREQDDNACWQALEIAQMDLADAKLAVPVDVLKEALRRGKVFFTWKAMRSWITPAPAPVVFYPSHPTHPLPPPHTPHRSNRRPPPGAPPQSSAHTSAGAKRA